METQLNLFAKFCEYDQKNPQVFDKFEELTFKTIAKGFKNYGAKGIFELIRWHSGVSGEGKFKVNNNYTPFYARKFEKKYPEHIGFFRKKSSKFD